MSQSSYDKALEELMREGILPDTSALEKNPKPVNNVTDAELQLILNMERIAGVKYSDEQKKILTNKGNSCIIACAGSGKALANGTGVLTDRGYRPIEDLLVYDVVYNDLGEEELVLGVYPQGKKQVYKITMNDNHVIKCCEDHLWTIRTGEVYKDRYGDARFATYEVTKSTKELYEQYLQNPILEIELPTLKLNELEVDKAQFDNCFGCSKEELIDALIAEDLSTFANSVGGYGNLNAWSMLDILDYVKNHKGTYKVKNKRLAQLIELGIELNGKHCTVFVDINGVTVIDVLDTEKSSIIKIEKTDEYEEMTCIKVSGRTELFLTEHCYVTHNTTVLTNLIAKRILTGEIKNTNKMVCTTYSKGGATEMEERLHALLQKFGMDRPIKVATMHAFFLSIIRTFGVQMGILDEGERMMMIKESAKEANVELRDEDLADLANLISFQINNLMSDKKALQSEANTLDQLTLENYAQVRKGFAIKKAQAYKMDFDDMQLYLYKWLVKDKTSENEAERISAINVRNYCHAMWDDFYIDEAQDISKIQFAIIREMIQDPEQKGKLVKNLTFVGDDDQCIVEGTPILTSRGWKPIEEIEYFDRVITANGRGKTGEFIVDNISKKYVNEKVIRITTESGKVLTGTKDHVGFITLDAEDDVYYNYLMYKQGYGFRTGVTSGNRNGNRKEDRNGLEMRMMQERADKMWLLKRSATLKEALYYEQYFAYKYRIPMYRFLTDDLGSGIPKTALDSEDVLRLHEEVGTYNNGMELLNKLGLDFNRPHKMSQADPDLCRYRLNFTLFGDKVIDKYGVRRSVLEANTSDSKYAEILERHLSSSVKKSSTTDYTYKCCNSTISDINTQLEKMENILRDCDDTGIEVGVNLQAKLTSRTYIEMPFAGIKEGMGIPVAVTNDENVTYIIDDVVAKVEEIDYEGYVYDLSVPDTRNFIANGVVVHNCIYKWRGADPSIILNIGNQFDMNLLMLSTNYRCAENIVDFAAESVQHNSARYSKSMKAFNKGGKVQIALTNKGDLCNLSGVTLNYVKDLIAKGESPKDICIMSRNNFHLAILNNMLLHEGIYTTCTHEMKLTNSSMYKDVKMILRAVRDEYDLSITRGILWKLCKFMSVANANSIAKFQDEACLTLRQTIAYLFRYCDGDRRVSVLKDKDGNEKDPKIHKQVEEQARYTFKKLNFETKEYLRKVLSILDSESDATKIGGLLTLYIGCTGDLLYKREDKNRSIRGLCNYISLLIDKAGYDSTMDFLRISEQYEQGKLDAPGAKVTLTTIHSAKGKEWKNVVAFAVDNVTMPGFEDIKSMIKEGNTLNEINEYIDEERRLYYVEMTRAKNNLLIVTNEPSVFLMESLKGIKDTGDSSNNMIIDCCSDDSYVRAQQRSNLYDAEVLKTKVIDENGEFHYKF